MLFFCDFKFLLAVQKLVNVFILYGANLAEYANLHKNISASFARFAPSQLFDFAIRTIFDGLLQKRSEKIVKVLTDCTLFNPCC
jgi:hypothetical protein